MITGGAARVRRLPLAAFVTLVVATVGAFFVIQHLKVTTPLINGFPAPYPSAIDPVNGKVCLRPNPKGEIVPVNFKLMTVSFYLQHHADNVDVYIVDDGGDVVRELPGSGVHMRPNRRHSFVWNGREDDGSIAPDGIYYIRVVLVHQARAVVVSNQNTGKPWPVTVITTPPRPRLISVSPSRFAQGSQTTVRINFSGNDGQRPEILLYRAGPGGSNLVKSFASTAISGHSVWNGEIGGVPAPPGTYLVALSVTDKACNTGTFPARLPPVLGSTPHGEITVT